MRTIQTDGGDNRVGREVAEGRVVAKCQTNGFEDRGAGYYRPERRTGLARSRRLRTRQRVFGWDLTVNLYVCTSLICVLSGEENDLNVIAEWIMTMTSGQ